MSGIVGFIIGVLVGAAAGVFTTALVSANRDDDNE